MRQAETGLLVGLGPVPRNSDDSYSAAVSHASVRKQPWPGAFPDAAGVTLLPGVVQQGRGGVIPDTAQVCDSHGDVFDKAPRREAATPTVSLFPYRLD